MKLLLFAVLLAPLSCALAQEAQDEKRLSEELAVTSSIVMQQADELESSVRFDQYKFSQPAFERKSTVAAEFQYGLTDRWELDTEIPYRFRSFTLGHSSDGIGDVEAGARYAVIPLNKGPVALDLGLTVGIPTGDRSQDLGEGRLTLEPSFTASTWLGPVNAQLSGGWQRAVTNAREEPRDEFEYNVAILYPIQHWFLGLEGNGISTREATEYYVTPEVIWRPIPRLEFLVAAPIGVTHTSADFGIVASVTLELDNFLHRGVDKD